MLSVEEHSGTLLKTTEPTIECGSPQFEGTDQYKHVKWTLKGMDKQALSSFLNTFHMKETKGSLFGNQELRLLRAFSFIWVTYHGFFFESH